MRYMLFLSCFYKYYLKYMNPQGKEDFLVKVLIIGQNGSGKTNILLRFCDQSFVQKYMPTIGVDFMCKTLDVENCKIKLQIWDTSGQERFRNLNATCYKGASVVILTYQVNGNKKVQENLEKYIKQMEEFTSPQTVKFLIANKCDLPDHTIQQEFGMTLASENNMEFMEVSAKEGTNIDKLFTRVAERVYHEIIEKVQENPSEKDQNLDIVKKKEQEQGAGAGPSSEAQQIQLDQINL